MSLSSLAEEGSSIALVLVTRESLVWEMTLIVAKGRPKAASEGSASLCQVLTTEFGARMEMRKGSVNRSSGRP